MSNVVTTLSGTFKATGRLGREIKISPKSHISLSEGKKIVFPESVETVDLVIGIGKDHVAYLVMTREAWNELNNGAPIDITTTKQFENGDHLPKKKTPAKKVSSKKKVNAKRRR